MCIRDRGVDVVVVMLGSGLGGGCSAGLVCVVVGSVVPVLQHRRCRLAGGQVPCVRQRAGPVAQQ
eukprot:7669191-Pyramimonas_sp.AAC.1